MTIARHVFIDVLTCAASAPAQADRSAAHRLLANEGATRLRAFANRDYESTTFAGGKHFFLTDSDQTLVNQIDELGHAHLSDPLIGGEQTARRYAQFDTCIGTGATFSGSAAGLPQRIELAAAESIAVPATDPSYPDLLATAIAAGLAQASADHDAAVHAINFDGVILASNVSAAMGEPAWTTARNVFEALVAT